MKNSSYIFSSFGYFQKVRVFEAMFEIPEIKQTKMKSPCDIEKLSFESHKGT